MKNPFKNITTHNKKNAGMKDPEYKYKVAAGFIWWALVGGLITLIMVYL